MFEKITTAACFMIFRRGEKKKKQRLRKKKNPGPFVKYILTAFFHSSVERDAGTLSIF